MSAADTPRGRRRFRRVAGTLDDDGRPGAGDPLDSVHAELVLLREENARLKSAPHQGADISSLLLRARSAPSRLDDRSVADETTRVLVEGLVIRESLLEICQEIERAMVSFEARLKALESTGSLNGRARA